MNSKRINTQSLGEVPIWCLYSHIYLQESIISHLPIAKSIHLDYRRPWSFKAYLTCSTDSLLLIICDLVLNSTYSDQATTSTNVGSP